MCLLDRRIMACFNIKEEHYTLRRKTASGRSPEALEAPEVAVKIVKDALEEDSDLWWMKRKKQDKNAQRCPTCQVRKQSQRIS